MGVVARHEQSGAHSMGSEFSERTEQAVLEDEESNSTGLVLIL